MAIVEVVDLDVVKDFSGPNPETVTQAERQHLHHHGDQQRPVQRRRRPARRCGGRPLDVTGVSTDTGTCAAPAQLVACDLNDLAHGASAVMRTVTYSVAAEGGPGRCRQRHHRDRRR